MQTKTTKTAQTYWVKIFLSGPIEEAKTILRHECFRKGLCVTISPTLYIYTGGEEAGYVVELIQYPRFPAKEKDILGRAKNIACELMHKTAQWSALVMDKNKTQFITLRKEG